MKMTEKELQELKSKLDEMTIVYGGLTEDLIREFSTELLEKMDWGMLDYTKFSEDFIRDYSDYVDWIRVSTDMKLSESFIREFSNKLDWYLISFYQIIPDKLLNEFKDEINWMGYFSPYSASSKCREKNAREIL